MRIKFTSSSPYGVSKVLQRVTISLQGAIEPLFVNASYGAGIGQFSVTFVALPFSLSENEKAAKNQSRVGILRNPFATEKIKHIHFALPFDPEVLKTMAESEVCAKFCYALLDRLKEPKLRIPKAFNYDGFAADLSAEIEKYLHASSTLP